MHVRNAVFCAVLVASASAARSATLPGGSYGCYTYNPKPIYVGEISISGGRYVVARFGTEGNYDYDIGSGKVAWKDKPPMGFEVAVLETDATSGRKLLRMYPKAADIGNKWKAAVCSMKEGGAGAAASGGASSGASAAAANAKASAFKPGDKVTAEFIGVPYPATVVAAEGARVRLHYDDPKSKDEWVDATRVKLKK